MKNTAVFFLLALSGYVLASTEYEGFDQNEGLRDFITDLINKTFNNVVKNMSDPLTIQNVTLKFDNFSSLSGQGNVSNMSLSGVSDIIAPYLKVDIFSGTINMTIELPKTLITFHYWLDAVFADLIPLYGSGFSTLSLDHVFLNISAGFSLTGGMHVQNVSVVPKINNATFNLDGLLNNSQMTSLINAILDDKACDFIDRCSGTISKIVSPVVQKFINDALKYNGTTVQDVIPHEIYL